MLKLLLILLSFPSLSIISEINTAWGVHCDGDGIVYTEKSGAIVEINETDTVRHHAWVDSSGEGGMLDIERHKGNYYTTSVSLDGCLQLKRWASDFSSDTVLFELPVGDKHIGGRIAINDSNIFLTVGDNGDIANAYDLYNFYGKVLAISLVDYSVTPFTYGHRNPQGIDFVGNQIFITEHGTYFDEFNFLQAGHGYGWGGFGLPPAYYFSSAIAPSGCHYMEGIVWVASLKRQSLYAYNLDTVQRYDLSEFGRIRDVCGCPDGSFLFVTSNNDAYGLGGSDYLVRAVYDNRIRVLMDGNTDSVIVDNKPFKRYVGGFVNYCSDTMIVRARAHLATKTTDTDIYLYAGDFNQDGAVTVQDFNLYQMEAGQFGDDLLCDANGDKVVTLADFNLYYQNTSRIGNVR